MATPDDFKRCGLRIAFASEASGSSFRMLSGCQSVAISPLEPLPKVGSSYLLYLLNCPVGASMSIINAMDNKDAPVVKKVGADLWQLPCDHGEREV
eukprot:6176697-Pleurochrysis_carterae.AAC.2